MKSQLPTVALLACLCLAGCADRNVGVAAGAGNRGGGVAVYTDVLSLAGSLDGVMVGFSPFSSSPAPRYRYERGGINYRSSTVPRAAGGEAVALPATGAQPLPAPNGVPPAVPGGSPAAAALPAGETRTAGPDRTPGAVFPVPYQPVPAGAP